MVCPGFEILPLSVVESILAKLDVRSICSAAASCKLLKICAGQALSSLLTFQLLDVSPKFDLLQRLVPSNLSVKCMKLDCASLDDSAIDYVINPSLEELCLQNCENFSARLLVEIGRNCKNLRALSLDLLWLDDSQANVRYGPGILELLRGCSQLESLRLMVDRNVPGNIENEVRWDSLATTLKELDLDYVWEGDVIQIFRMANFKLDGSMPANISLEMQKSNPYLNLQKLSLNLNIISDRLVNDISKNLPHLTHLDLRDEPVIEPFAFYDLTNRGIQMICCCSKLQHLSLVRSQRHCAASFKRVNDLGILLMVENSFNLKSVRLGGFCRITDAGFRAILHACLYLQKLELLCTPQLTDLVFHDLSATPLSLTHVTMQSCHLITDFSIMRLSYCKNLQHLDLRGCRAIGDDSMKAVLSLTKLETLLLNGSDISDMGLSAFGNSCTRLVTLSLRSCIRITDKGITALFDSCYLVTTLENLDLSYIPNISDKSILHLARRGMNIVELRLRECPNIGDTSVMALASMHFQDRRYGSTLKLLDIFNCPHITKLGMSWFRKPYFPSLRWLGLGWRVQDHIVDTLVKLRPGLQISQDGNELHGSQKDNIETFYSCDTEKEDELEQWLDYVEPYEDNANEEVQQWFEEIEEIST